MSGITCIEPSAFISGVTTTFMQHFIIRLWDVASQKKLKGTILSKPGTCNKTNLSPNCKYFTVFLLFTYETWVSHIKGRRETVNALQQGAEESI
jgi:hypothetical protein